MIGKVIIFIMIWIIGACVGAGLGKVFYEITHKEKQIQEYEKADRGDE